MLVALLGASASLPSRSLPPRFVLKLFDPRFADPESLGGLMDEAEVCQWTTKIDEKFNKGIARVRNGLWSNYWTLLDGSRDVPVDERAEADYDSRRQRVFMTEMDRWEVLRDSHPQELRAYRRLRRLQGVCIPRLYGTCVYNASIGPVGPTLPIAKVPGLLIEYIDGTRIDKLVLGKHISVDDAERISQGVLAVLRKFRDNLVIHGDVAGRNILVRQGDFDHPVIIDFGNAKTVRGADATEHEYQEWKDHVVEASEVFDARGILAELGFHKPSPVPEEAQKCDDVHIFGHALRNRDIERIRSDWRDALYERVDRDPSEPPIIKKSPGGSEHRWEPSRWNIRPEVNTANASADFRWGKKEYQKSSHHHE